MLIYRPIVPFLRRYLYEDCASFSHDESTDLVQRCIGGLADVDSVCCKKGNFQENLKLCDCASRESFNSNTCTSTCIYICFRRGTRKFFQGGPTLTCNCGSAQIGKIINFFISSNIGDIKLCKFKGGGGVQTPPTPL